MKKKCSLIILTFCIFCHNAGAKSLSNELVDLHKSHWAYNATTKLIDKYSLVQGFPDHTFRGEKRVNRYEFSVIILNLIKYLEEKRRVSLKPNESISIYFRNKSFEDIPQNYWAQAAIIDLRNSYNLILSSPYENVFGGNKNISRFELAYAIDKVISPIENQVFMDKNPYIISEQKQDTEKPPLTKITPDIFYEQSIKNIISHKIMVGFDGSNDFKGLGEVDRYQLATVLIKALEYIESIRLN